MSADVTGQETRIGDGGAIGDDEYSREYIGEDFIPSFLNPTCKWAAFSHCE